MAPSRGLLRGSGLRTRFRDDRGQQANFTATYASAEREGRQPLATDEYGKPLSESDERAKLRPVVAAPAIWG